MPAATLFVGYLMCNENEWVTGNPSYTSINIYKRFRRFLGVRYPLRDERARNNQGGLHSSPADTLKAR